MLLIQSMILSLTYTFNNRFVTNNYINLILMSPLPLFDRCCIYVKLKSFLIRYTSLLSYSHFYFVPKFERGKKMLINLKFSLSVKNFYTKTQMIKQHTHTQIMNLYTITHLCEYVLGDI